MSHRKTTAFVLTACVMCTASFAQNAPTFTLRKDIASPDVIARSTHIPFDKRYAELTLEQKAVLNSMYESMAPQDEPPFPMDGLIPIVKAMYAAQAKLLVTGTIKLIVNVSAAGEATSVTAIGSLSPEMTRFAASILAVTKYKPALCGGTPCEQKYPFILDFEVQ